MNCVGKLTKFYPVLEDCSQYMTNPVITELPEGIKDDGNMDISPIEPNLYALTLARNFCRMQMAKIVQEVLYQLAMATGVFACLLTNPHTGRRCGKRSKYRLCSGEGCPFPKP